MDVTAREASEIPLGARPVRDRAARWPAVIAFAAPFLCAMAIALIANHAWEDWYITYRSSKNLALGYGLVFDIGQRVHSFTSPLGTLVPAAIKALGISDDAVLWGFRLVQSAFLGFAGLLFWSLARARRLPGWLAGVGLALICLDAKTLDFATNGMETGFLVFFTVLTAYATLLKLRWRAVVLGVAWAGLMWTRPDGFIYAAALALAAFVFAERGGRIRLIRDFVVAAFVGALLYGPWLIWTTSYYGTFVPHSLLAKGVGYVPTELWRVVLFPLALLPGHLVSTMGLDLAFSPAYVQLGGWPSLVTILSRVVEFACCFLWVLPVLRRETRLLSLAVLVVQLYFGFAVPNVAPWYMPPVAVLSYVLITLALGDLVARYGSSAGLLRLAQVVCAFGLLYSAALTACVAYQQRILQRVVEDGERRQIGLWLHDHAASPQDSVFVEPLGYIGFFSGLHMHGWPGQSSPAMVEARIKLGCYGGLHCFAGLIRELDPEWVVLRGWEAPGVAEDDPDLLTNRYTLAQEFDISSQIKSYRFLPGWGLLWFDRRYLVYKRVGA